MTETTNRPRVNLVPDLRSVPELTAWLREQQAELDGVDGELKADIARLREDAAKLRKKLRAAIRQGDTKLGALMRAGEGHGT